MTYDDLFTIPVGRIWDVGETGNTRFGFPARHRVFANSQEGWTTLQYKTTMPSFPPRSCHMSLARHVFERVPNINHPTAKIKFYYRLHSCLVSRRTVCQSLVNGMQNRANCSGVFRCNSIWRSNPPVSSERLKLVKLDRVGSWLTTLRYSAGQVALEDIFNTCYGSKPPHLRILDSRQWSPARCFPVQRHLFHTPVASPVMWSSTRNT